MQLNLDVTRLGRCQLFNPSNEKHCVVGLICKAAGLEDLEMNSRKGLVFIQVDDETPPKDLPVELEPFFDEVAWNPVVKSLKGSRKFMLSTVGNQIANLSDTGLAGESANWQEQITDVLASNNVEATWGPDEPEVLVE